MLFFFPFFADTVLCTGFLATCTGKKNHGSRETRLEAFFLFEIPGDQLQDHKLFGTNQGVINGKKLKKGGHC